MDLNTPFFKTPGGAIVILSVVLTGVALAWNNIHPTKRQQAALPAQKLTVNADSLQRVRDVERFEGIERRLSAFRVEQYTTSAPAAIEGADELQEIGMLIVQAQSDSLFEARAKAWKRQLVSLQSKSFPALRRAWVGHADKIMWKDDIDITGSGTTVTFTGGTFAANRNIADFYEQVSETLLKLRFRRANFKWYKDADEFTYYTIKSVPDTDL